MISAKLQRVHGLSRCTAGTYGRPATARPLIRCRVKEEGSEPATPAAAPPSEPVPTPAVPTPAPPATEDASAESDPAVLQKGQGMAIVTGGISIVFGLAYLALVYLMDSRGGQMQPPPPEAFM